MYAVNALLCQALQYKLMISAVLPSQNSAIRTLSWKNVVIEEERGLSGRIGTFSGPILEQIGTFYRYLNQNAELLKKIREHNYPISRHKKVHLHLGEAERYTAHKYQFLCYGCDSSQIRPAILPGNLFYLI